MGLISIILPVADDATRLDRTVVHTQYEAGLWPTEIVVVATGQQDVAAMETSLKVRAFDCTGCSRAEALNCGAKEAKGEVLLFVSHDSLLPRRFAESIWWALKDPRVVGGAFDLDFDPFPYTHGFNRHALAAVRQLSRIRFRWTGNYLIEQGIFIRRETFDAIGGFRKVKQLEDLYFSRSMKRAGKTAVLGPPLQASPRRFLRGGVIRQFAADLLLLGKDGFGSRGGGRVKFPRNKPQLLPSQEVVKGEA